MSKHRTLTASVQSNAKNSNVVVGRADCESAADDTPGILTVTGREAFLLVVVFFHDPFDMKISYDQLVLATIGGE